MKDKQNSGTVFEQKNPSSDQNQNGRNGEDGGRREKKNKKILLG